MPVTNKVKMETVDETPAQKMMRESRTPQTVVDSRGRTIVYKRLSVLDTARLLRHVGSEAAQNQMYMNYVNLAAMVQSIDNEPGPPATSLMMIESRMDWLGDEGFEAVSNHLVKILGTEEVDAQKFREDVKN